MGGLIDIDGLTTFWSNVKKYITSKIPTKLSELTDDVVSGKYLSTNGGSVNGNLTISSGTLISADHAIQTPSIDIENDIVFSAGNPNEVTVTIGVDSSSKGYLTLKDTNTNSAINLKGVATPTENTDAANKQYVDDAVAGSGGSSSGYNLFSVTYGGAAGATEYLSLREAIINGSPLYFGYSDAGIVSYNCSAVISNIGTDNESIIILLEDMYNMLGSIGSVTKETEIGVAGCYSQQGATFIFKKSDYSVTGGANLLPDSSMSSVSQNSVQNKVVKAYIDDALGDIKTILASI